MRSQASVGEAQHRHFEGSDVSVRDAEVCVVDSMPCAATAHDSYRARLPLRRYDSDLDRKHLGLAAGFFSHSQTDPEAAKSAVWFAKPRRHHRLFNLGFAAFGTGDLA